MMVELNSETFPLYAVQAYNNPLCTSEREYREDLNRLVTLKRNLSRFVNDPDSISIKLVVNSFISYFNVFELKPAVNMLFFNMKPELQPHAKAILYFLNLLPYQIDCIDLNMVVMSRETYKALRDHYDERRYRARQ